MGSVKADYITLVRTPRLRKMDQPYPEDLAAFEQNIAQALKIQMAGAIKRPRIDLSLIEDVAARLYLETGIRSSSERLL